MILEGILTTEREDGGMHMAPMGPRVSTDLRDWTLRPFQTSTTFANLRRAQRGIFHVTDDALLLVQAVLGNSTQAESHWQAPFGHVLRNATHWYALQLEGWDVSQPRAQVQARVVAQGVQRPFFGWNRAKHAILEACILYSRIDLLDPSEIVAESERLAMAVEKTAGPDETAAWQLLLSHMEPRLRRE
jgi:hypothetical protein